MTTGSADQRISALLDICDRLIIPQTRKIVSLITL
jgi:hypothetical protein